MIINIFIEIYELQAENTLELKIYIPRKRL